MSSSRQPPSSRLELSPDRGCRSLMTSSRMESPYTRLDLSRAVSSGPSLCVWGYFAVNVEGTTPSSSNRCSRRLISVSASFAACKADHHIFWKRHSDPHSIRDAVTLQVAAIVPKLAIEMCATEMCATSKG